jgi:hypothetical protein
MTIHDVEPPALNLEDVKGTIWEGIAALGDQFHPFSLDSPTQDEAVLLAVGEVRRITYKGSGQVLLYNLDVPSGVTLAVNLDGVTKRFSHGDEAGVLRWEYGKSPMRFTNTLELVITNTTANPQVFRVHVSGA